MAKNFKLSFTGDWKELKSTLRDTPKAIKRMVRVGPRSEAKYFQDKIVSGICKQAPGGKKFRPLSPSTLVARRAAGVGGDKALISTGEMVDSIRVKAVGKGFFVGVPNRTKGGRNLAEVAAIHENGAGPFVIKMTPKMRAFIFGVLAKGSPRSGGGGSKPGFVVMRVPARPFIKPTFDKYGKRVLMYRRVMGMLSRLMRGRLGNV
jgi:hypothetical protein